MTRDIHTVITGTGSFIPKDIVDNRSFCAHEFYDSHGKAYPIPNTEIIQKFEDITGIRERRYVTEELVTSDIATHAACEALASSEMDRETLDYIIVAHNFGDIRSDARRSDMVPSLAARVKHKLGVKNPKTIAYDLPFGCPGWLQGVIQTDYYLRSGDARRSLVIGAETLSRVIDPHDRDSMIYADGAGAAILEARQSDRPTGILSHATRCDTINHAYLLLMEKSYNGCHEGDEFFLKMDGHKVYEYALRTVPEVVKESLSKASISLRDVKKILLHQANEKLDHAILKRVYRLFGEKEIPTDVMPMTISWLGNSSVATLPTLLDLLMRGELDNHELDSGDVIVFASVGAGMNINALVYEIP